MRMLVRALVFLGSAALGLLAAALILDDVEVTASGFVVTAVIFAVVQSLVTPLEKVARDKASALLGGIGVVAALVALLVASLVGDALTISGGVGTWVLAALIVWVVTALATVLLPVVLTRLGGESAGDRGRVGRRGGHTARKSEGEARGVA